MVKKFLTGLILALLMAGCIRVNVYYQEPMQEEYPQDYTYERELP